MSAARKSIVATKHPARPRKGKLDVKALCAETSRRYPKILAELAK